MGPPRIATKPAPDLEIPEVFSRLRDVAYNLWWAWSSQAHRMFAAIDRTRWLHYRNPIELLIDLKSGRWRALADDAEFTTAYHAVVDAFDNYMDPRQSTWYQGLAAKEPDALFAYFSTEYGLHECLQTYSGGLGVLSGDHCKSASDLGLPFIGVGLMYQFGYFSQTIDVEGFQQHVYPDYDLHRLPLLMVVDAAGRELHVPVDIADRRVYLRVWKATVGRVPVLLLDSDLPINHPADRPITSVLYVAGREMRLCQEIVLGMGGVRVLDALGLRPTVWHLNEGHSALMILERLRAAMAGGTATFDAAFDEVRRNALFTTHTPVPAGNETFDVELVRRYLAPWSAAAGLDLERVLELGRTAGESNGVFNMTALALRGTTRANAVSELHAKTANAMWRGLLEAEARPEISHVTNGVHQPSWIGPQIEELLERHLGRDFAATLDDRFEERIAAIPDYELWVAHRAQKQRLVALIRQLALRQYARHGRSPETLRSIEHLFDHEALIIGFARRFATYKRADLILRDPARLKALISDSKRPVQLVFAGKAHPADRPGQDLIRRICQFSESPEIRGRVLFLENYDLRIARGLVQGVDVWLNTPRRPQEASGTSGMKAAMNGVLNLSVLDGWWAEAYDPALGWSIGGTEARDDESQDREDVESLYRVLTDEVLPCYYQRNEQGLPVEWLRRMKLTLGRLSPRFSTQRMVREYVERFYLREEQAPDVATRDAATRA